LETIRANFRKNSLARSPKTVTNVDLAFEGQLEEEDEEEEEDC